MSATSAHEAQNCTSRRAPVIPSPSGRFTSSEASFRHSSQSSTLSVLAAYSNCCHVEAPSSDVLAAMLVGMQLANRSEVEKEGRFAKSRMESQDQRNGFQIAPRMLRCPLAPFLFLRSRRQLLFSPLLYDRRYRTHQVGRRLPGACDRFFLPAGTMRTRCRVRAAYPTGLLPYDPPEASTTSQALTARLCWTNKQSYDLQRSFYVMSCQSKQSEPFHTSRTMERWKFRSEQDKLRSNFEHFRFPSLLFLSSFRLPFLCPAG